MNRGRAVRFTRRAEGWIFTLHEDGNNNGVLNSEIVSNIDLTIQAARPLGDPAERIDIGFPPAGLADPDTAVWIDPESSPVNFNRSALCSFAPNGTATPGTIYLSAGDTAAAVRCSGEGNVRTMYWDAAARVWTRSP